MELEPAALTEPVTLLVETNEGSQHRPTLFRRVERRGTRMTPPLGKGREAQQVYDEAVLRERARSDKHTARVLFPDPLTGGEQTRLLYVRDVGLIVAGPGLTTRPKAIETPTLRKRRKDRMKGRLEPLVRFGMFEVCSEGA